MNDPQPQTYSTRKKTVWVLVVSAIALGLWDVYAAHAPAGSISEVVLGVAHNHPWVTLLIGGLLGHLFAPQVPITKAEVEEDAAKADAPKARPRHLS